MTEAIFYEIFVIVFKYTYDKSKALFIIRLGQFSKLKFTNMNLINQFPVINLLFCLDIRDDIVIGKLYLDVLLTHAHHIMLRYDMFRYVA